MTDNEGDGPLLRHSCFEVIWYKIQIETVFHSPHLVTFRSRLGETSKLIGCSLHIQQPAAAILYRKCYTLLLKAAAFWLQPAVMIFDVFPYTHVIYSTPRI